jgi:hypothetical protein
VTALAAAHKVAGAFALRGTIGFVGGVARKTTVLERIGIKAFGCRWHAHRKAAHVEKVKSACATAFSEGEALAA